MNLRLTSLVLLLLVSLGAERPSAYIRVAAPDPIYVQFPGVTGPVTIKGFTGWIGLNSWSFGAATSNGLLLPAIRTPSQFTKLVDATTPIFLQHFFNRQPFKGTTKIDAVLPGRSLEEIQLLDAVVLQDNSAGSPGRNEETIALSYDAIQYCYTPQNRTGPMGKPVCTSWNYKSHSP